ncbi:glyoxalase [Roseibium denhamense]|uniref:Glyoxalase/Bleomycin resistance protein/Dioxygenase superfamily protein n=1 Tax=Roseibium denhamense TaxID=76305 RepID=A0ABY1N7J3_9HYPH|nr:VOC family protein [Roseibium denhamense]MTI05974.1 glyoxalase [Roseibium denhamense]SMP02577.1 Glyoxalase/Bleomycin resistance protein/Dioxygenase superfamily protein [Roseibium denhamense]
MKCTQYYPVLMTDNVAETAGFYRENFKFKAVFEADWYVHLQSAEDKSVNLAVLDRSHETIPEEGRGRTSAGLLLNFEVEDVDAVYADAQKKGLPVLLALKDEPFGQRHFITKDPNGVLIDVIKPIPPSPEFLAQFAPEAVPA